jgi:hypothetical protein
VRKEIVQIREEEKVDKYLREALTLTPHPPSIPD